MPMHTTTLWKPLTFLMGLSWLVWGAAFLHYPDWDLNLSVLMAGCTYLTAEQFIASWENAVKQKRPSWSLCGWCFGAWVSIDGVYWLYWSLVDIRVAIREGQWPMSACLYLLCGMLWHSFDPGKRPTSLPQPLQDPGLPEPKKPQNGTAL